MQGAVASVMRNNTRERYMVDAALKHCKAFLCTLKGEERRKVGDIHSRAALIYVL